MLVAIKYLESRTPRDATLLVCLACFLLVTPFFYSQSLLSGGDRRCRRCWPRRVAGRAGRRSRRPAAAPLAWRPALLAARRAVRCRGMPLAALLFVLFPRPDRAAVGAAARDDGAHTGLSSSMSPGLISKLSLSDAVAFRVEFDGAVPPPRERYWRGPVLSRFDGRTWSSGNSPACARPRRPAAGAASPTRSRWSRRTAIRCSRSSCRPPCPSSRPATAAAAGVGGPYAHPATSSSSVRGGVASATDRYTQRPILRSD